MEWLMQGSNSKDIQEGNVINANQCSFLKKPYISCQIILMSFLWDYKFGRER